VDNANANTNDRWLSLQDALAARQANRTMRELVMSRHGAARLVLGFVVPQLVSAAGVPSSADFTSPAHSTSSVWRCVLRCGVISMMLISQYPHTHTHTHSTDG
jgi:hypothetical protein